MDYKEFRFDGLQKTNRWEEEINRLGKKSSNLFNLELWNLFSLSLNKF